jgi:hypothetical protein
MTIDEAKQSIGRKVIYRPSHSHAPVSEEGVITSVNDTYVFVRYGSQTTSAATYPRDLSLLAREGEQSS